MTRSRKRPADSAQSKTPRMSGHSTRENRETHEVAAPEGGRSPVGEGSGQTADVHASRESDEGIVPTNAPNNDASSGPRRGGREGLRPRRTPRHLPHPGLCAGRVRLVSRWDCSAYGSVAVDSAVRHPR